MIDEYAYLSEFIKHIDVECPKCSSHALVVSDKNTRSNARFTCTSCGKNAKWNGQSGIFQSSGPSMEYSNFIVLGRPFDCYFKFPLWYRFEFKANIFFAYNKEHLLFLKEYISDPLRKRKQNQHGWSNGSLQSRLPKWILSANNRDVLIRKIELIENK